METGNSEAWVKIDIGFLLLSKLVIEVLSHLYVCVIKIIIDVRSIRRTFVGMEGSIL
jgi:hypothetical protein